MSLYHVVMNSANGLLDARVLCRMAYCFSDQAPNDPLEVRSAQACAPLPQLRASLDRQLELGVQRSKLAPLLPWIGEDFQCDLTGKAPGGRANGRNCTTAPASQQHGIAQPGYGHAMRIAAGPGAALSFDAEQSSGVVDVLSRNSSGVIVSHRQLWIDTPQSIEEKVRWARAAGLAGVGFWTADAVASVDAYYWGPGCSGEASQKAGCPQNHTQTVANARAMWAAVRRALM